MIEAKISYKDGFDILTDTYDDEWAICVYNDSEAGKTIEFPNNDGNLVSYILSDVIEFLKHLEAKE